MRNPLVRRAFYSFLTTTAGLFLVYDLIAVFPSPRLWVANSTTNSGMLVQALVMLVIYGLPAWAVTYLSLACLGYPLGNFKVDPIRSAPDESLGLGIISDSFFLCIPICSSFFLIQPTQPHISR